MPSDTSSPRALRPRDAATLIVARHMKDGLRVLMGKRSEQHKFMPGKYVFPGGRVDFADSRIRPASDLPADVVEKLMTRMGGRPSINRARAMALAAIRETFEETGLALGAAVDGAPQQSKSAAWQAFFDTGKRPDLSALRLIGRAVTPPNRPRRFDSRFFLTERHDLDVEEAQVKASAELTEVAWLTLSEALDLDLPRVTRVVLESLAEQVTLPGGLSAPRPIPYFYHRGMGWVRDEL